ncbi:hypothetical protein E4U13_000704 [Claviceps humidiphila]|uniref:Uncharacterized protein n=1 Tax=Claviceps humidiphila TaxID=1294629 RepID=A0A9P7TUC9_9HYPO|nr:hypothetical protein E4U13_000704 [Claviceps humidiphila]
MADVEFEFSVDVAGKDPRPPWVRDSDEQWPERLNESNDKSTKARYLAPAFGPFYHINLSMDDGV